MSDNEKLEKLVADFASFVGKENVSGKIFERIAYGQDAMALDVMPDKIPLAVVKPGSAQQVSKVLEYCNNHKIPVIVHGSGSVFKGGAHPKRPGSITLDTARLNSFEMFEDDMYCEVGAGVNQLDLEEMLAKRGYFLTMNVGNKYGATIGGAVAVNTIGHMNDVCVGKISDYVMGVEAVLPNGAIIETGTKSLRRPAGVDFTRFFAGMEGLFGVITKIRLRLVPMPKMAYVVGFFKECEDAAHAIQRIYKEKLPPPLYGELLAKNTAVPAFRTRGLGTPPGDMVLITTMGHTQADADWQAEEIFRVFKAENAIEAHIVTSEEERVALWECRDFIDMMFQREEGEPKKAFAGGFECGVPLTRLADFFTYIRSLPPAYPVLSELGEPWFYGHIGPSGPHVIINLPTGIPMEKVEQGQKECLQLERELTVKWGGIGGEVGQMATRLPAFREKYGEAAYQMLVNVKRVIDPNNILNPGNLEGEL